MKPINLQYLWERHHGRLSAESRVRFLARPEATEICKYPLADVERAVIDNTQLADILATLRATSSPTGRRGRPAGPAPTGRGGKSHKTGQVWEAPLPQPNAKPDVDKPEPYNG